MDTDPQERRSRSGLPCKLVCYEKFATTLPVVLPPSEVCPCFRDSESRVTSGA